ncbi:uroporphyrinogen decarboxylase [Hyphomicrobium sp. LHD-15]|uniref:uroporphyrinogen decarboxylase n=1 Tax=Hyphomicrobium sp. LHD-15 TaxID=3072142 RepID=UPI00280DA4CF|nr:uroporphyrinogen decarboxylase [Hyphomicrobium sp. LHD-15]MDQ8698586.1 uroporphyrinogen decarboxylase [Hyphomicrobium sp. LHD-15]
MAESAERKPTATAKRRFLEPFRGEALDVPPIWLMRQAGRYLPEYRATRADAGDFLTLCYTPKLAAEVTLQPIRRYGFDAAILFSDILVVPDALGQTVRFVEGEGPRLDPIRAVGDLGQLDPAKTATKFGLVSETVARLRQDLPAETALIGFCGAPWTVATYMVQGQGSADQAEARLWAYRDPDGFEKLIDVLVETSIDYLDQQVKAGADCLQIFDTWAGSLPDDEFDRWVVSPTRTIREAIRDLHPDVPVIGFPRGAGAAAVWYVSETGVNGIGCDTATPPFVMSEAFDDEDVVVQGNLDPLLLVAGGSHLDERVDEILDLMRGKRFIFNLGHGIVPQTPPENVARLVERVRSKG